MKKIKLMRNAKNPMPSGVRALILATAVTLTTACHGPYDDLEKSFKASQSTSASPVPVDRVVLTSNRYRGAYSYDKALTVQLSSSTVELKPAFPFSVAMKDIAIPADAISGCSKTCFGDGVWDADFLLSSAGTEISFRSSRQVVDWCWANKIPMISGKDRRQWLYSGASLPDRSKFSEQLSSRESYDKQAKMSCLGY
jgi:hypothetical protein